MSTHGDGFTSDEAEYHPRLDARSCRRRFDPVVENQMHTQQVGLGPKEGAGSNNRDSDLCHRETPRLVLNDPPLDERPTEPRPPEICYPAWPPIHIRPTLPDRRRRGGRFHADLYVPHINASAAGA